MHDCRKTAPRLPIKRGQTAIEYLLLLSAVVVVVLLAFKSLLPRTTNTSSVFFDKVSFGIMGNQAGNFIGSDGQQVYKARTGRRNIYP